MITEMKYKTSEQHIELGRSRNIKCFKVFLKIRNPFSQLQTKLYFLSTQLYSVSTEECEEIHCDDDAELIGCKIAEEATVSLTSQPLEKGINIESQTVYIDPSIL